MSQGQDGWDGAFGSFDLDDDALVSVGEQPAGVAPTAGAADNWLAAAAAMEAETATEAAPPKPRWKPGPKGWKGFRRRTPAGETTVSTGQETRRPAVATASQPVSGGGSAATATAPNPPTGGRVPSTSPTSPAAPSGIGVAAPTSQVGARRAATAHASATATTTTARSTTGAASDPSPTTATRSATRRGRRRDERTDAAGLPDVLTVDETAALLRVDRKSAYAMIARHEIPGVRRVGRTIRVSRDRVLEWLREGGVARGRRRP